MVGRREGGWGYSSLFKKKQLKIQYFFHFKEDKKKNYYKPPQENIENFSYFFLHFYIFEVFFGRGEGGDCGWG